MNRNLRVRVRARVCVHVFVSVCVRVIVCLHCELGSRLNIDMLELVIIS